MPTALLLLLMASADPSTRELLRAADGGVCLASGVCPLPARPAVPSGVLFLSLGLVAAGVAGLRHERRAQAAFLTVAKQQADRKKQAAGS